MENVDLDDNKEGGKKTAQFSTFIIGDRLYGIDVMRVQEVTRSMKYTSIPLAPNYVHGLINLRGQLATAIGLRELFTLDDQEKRDQMNVVCRIDENLISFQVDKIGDVVELSESLYESTPDTIPESIRRFMDGVYKTENGLLSIIDIDKVGEALNQNA